MVSSAVRHRLTPEDFVVATGRQYSVRDFVNAAA